MTINEKNSAILFIDIQEKLVQMLKKDKITKKAYILSEMANILGIEKIFTEQYPKGLGSTIDTISKKETDKVFEKTAFNALLENGFLSTIKSYNKKQIVICGIESHICVLQTAVALIKEGFEVYVVRDICASRKKSEFKCAMELLRQCGAKICSLEIVLFAWLKGAKNPNFKDVQALIK